MTKYMVDEENYPFLHHLSEDFLALGKPYYMVLEGKPTYFKDTQLEYYVVTEENGLIGHKEHSRIEKKTHNTVQKVSCREDDNYQLYINWILKSVKDALGRSE